MKVKRIYKKPEIEEYGSLKTITKGDNPKTIDDLGLTGGHS